MDIQSVVTTFCLFILKVGQMVHAIKMGWMKRSSEIKKKTEDDEQKYFMLWKDDDEVE